jgi:hypothetical protein
MRPHRRSRGRVQIGHKNDRAPISFAGRSLADWMGAGISQQRTVGASSRGRAASRLTVKAGALDEFSCDEWKIIARAEIPGAASRNPSAAGRRCVCTNAHPPQPRHNYHPRATSPAPSRC